MNIIYLRIFFVSYVLFIALCVAVIAPLWWYNRKRSPEIALWLVDYIFQFIGLLLITLREIIPDFFSILVANFLLIGGTIILYIGLGRYVNRRVRQFHNYVMLTVFTAVQAYFTYGYPDAGWRTINLSIALFYICAQASWLMLRGADQSLRSATRTTGIVFALFCLISVVQVIVNLVVPETHTFIVSNLFGIFAVMMYQILFVALTFALFLMISRRLSLELERQRLQREQEERIIRTRLSLLEFAMTHSLDEVLQKTLDEEGDMVESPIGFYHFVEEDQKTLSLQAWSTRTLNEFCKAEGKGMHYAIDQAGVWTDCVLQKRAVIHNDYLSLPHRKGMPEGHAAVIRELVVPIMRGGKVMAILGVGNKPSDYNEKDVEIVSYLADVAWEITRRKKAEEAVSKYSNDLKERLKENNCLYSISEIVQRKDISQEELFKACPVIIAQAYQFPEITACRILIGDHEYHTDNFRQTHWSLSRTINVNGEPLGSVEVCYLEERHKEYEGPFLAEERNLINAVADILERYLDGKEAQDALRRSEEKYKQLAEVFPETIFEADMKGDVTYANPHGFQQFGFTEEDITRGINIFDYVSPDDRELVQERIQRRIQGENDTGYLEYDALKKDGSFFHAITLSVPIMAEGMVVGIRGFIMDITERKQIENYREMSNEILQILGKPDTIKDLMQKIVDVLKERTGVDAVGIRLREGNNYPYIAQSGFPAEFLLTENTLVQRSMDGDLCKDKDGNVMLECICGLVVSGKTDPANPLFTKGGSCWTNSSSAIMDLPPELDLRINPRNRCVVEGYVSLALIPIRTKETFAGLLQFNDRRKDCFSLSIIEQLESIAANIGEALMRREAEEQIKHLATHDLLTDLPSLRLAMDRLASALNMARRYKKTAAVMFIDLDGFKTVNDTLGHDAGDYVLKEVARRLLSCVRETDTVARVGGDEFLIIATEINYPDNAAQIAQKVIQVVSQPIFINGEQAVVGTSIGIALFPEHSEDMDKLIKLADEAMYKVKNSGKNNFRFVSLQ